MDPKAKEKVFSKGDPKGRSCASLAAVPSADFSTDAALEALVQKLAADHTAGTGDYIHPARLALSGTAVGPSFYGLLRVLGKERVAGRLGRFLATALTIQLGAGLISVLSQVAGVAQWIVQWPPKPSIRVRLPALAPCYSITRFKGVWKHGLPAPFSSCGVADALRPANDPGLYSFSFFANSAAVLSLANQFIVHPQVLLFLSTSNGVSVNMLCSPNESGHLGCMQKSLAR